MEKEKRPPGIDSGRGDDRRLDGFAIRNLEWINATPQVPPVPSLPGAEASLAWLLQSMTAGIRIVQRRGRVRISIETWTIFHGRWQLAAVSPSFAAVMLDTVIDALHRDKR